MFNPIKSELKVSGYEDPVVFFQHYVLRKYDPFVPYYPDYMLSCKRLFCWCRCQAARHGITYADYVDTHFDSILMSFDARIQQLTLELLNYRFNIDEFLSLQELKRKYNDCLALKHEHEVIDDELIRFKVYSLLEKRKLSKLREIL